MSDIFGTPVVGGRLNLTRSDGYSNPLLTGPNGAVEIPDDVWEESALFCGDVRFPLKAIARGEPFPIPGPSAALYGELAILPLDWVDLKVSLLGLQKWRSSAAVDKELGHRFLYLLPGTYEIADYRYFVLGTAEVAAGRRTTFVMTKWSGLKINLSFVVEPEAPTSLIAVMVKGVSAGASFQNPAGFLMMRKADHRSHTHYGLVPGVYRVYVDEHYQVHDFSEVIDLEEGKVRTFEVRLTLR